MAASAVRISIRRSAKTTLNKWIYAEANSTAAAVTEAIENYRFNDAASEVYRFVWNKFCDWYVEFAKPVFMGSDDAAKAETQAMAAWALDEILKLLHPFMPFVTEELWAVLGENGPKRESLLCLAEWPKADKNVGPEARRGGELGHRPDQRNPVAPLRDECAASVTAPPHDDRRR